jgi:hypothetical protein
VADVEDADGGADGEVLGDESAGGAESTAWIFDRHVPAIEVHHAGAKLAVRGVESSLTDDGGFSVRQGWDLGGSRLMEP